MCGNVMRQSRLINAMSEMDFNVMVWIDERYSRQPYERRAM